MWIPINSASDVGAHDVCKMETPVILWGEYPQCNGPLTSYTAELFITKLTAALFVICPECYETIRGHQKKGEKFKGQGQMCWRSCKEENMASGCTVWKVLL